MNKALANEFFKELIDYNKDEWRDQAICNGMDPNTFFTDIGNGQQDQSRLAVALDACGRCPVTEQCLDFALKNNIHQGIYGGSIYSRYRRGWVNLLDPKKEVKRK